MLISLVNEVSHVLSEIYIVYVHLFLYFLGFQSHAARCRGCSGGRPTPSGGGASVAPSPCGSETSRRHSFPRSFHTAGAGRWCAGFGPPRGSGSHAYKAPRASSAAPGLGSNASSPQPDAADWTAFCFALTLSFLQYEKTLTHVLSLISMDLFV